MSNRKFSESYSMNLHEYSKGAHGRHMQSVTEHEQTAAIHYEREVSRSSNQAMHPLSLRPVHNASASVQNMNGLLPPVRRTTIRTATRMTMAPSEEDNDRSPVTVYSLLA